MLYSNIQLDEVNVTFHYGLELTKTAVLDELKPGRGKTLVDGVEVWSPHDILMNAELLRERLVKAAVDTAYRRYWDWHSKLRKKSYSRPACKK